MNRFLALIVLAGLVLTISPLSGEPGAPSLRQAQEAIRRGVAYLIGAQNPDGSWGSHKGTVGFDIYASPGTHMGWRVATTGLAVSALLETTGPRPPREAMEAARRGLRFLLAECPPKRPNQNQHETIWGHLYGLSTFAKALGRPELKDLHGELRASASRAIAAMGDLQALDGGWNYYNFGWRLERPVHSNSFTTASALVALHEARSAGIAVPDLMVKRALRLLEHTRLPTGAYTYGAYVFSSPGGALSINRTEGSLSRIQAGNLALALWGKLPERADLAKGLDDLFAGHRFLDIAWKRPYPHEAFFANSGYFYLYGHFYAAGVIRLLPREKQVPYRARLREHLLKFQADDGSWWDFYIYSYHKPYGTAFALLALAATLDRK